MKNTKKALLPIVIVFCTVAIFVACSDEAANEPMQNEYEITVQQGVYENNLYEDEAEKPNNYNFIWIVPPTLEHEHIYHCCGDFSTEPHGGMAIDGITGQLTGEYAVVGDHGPLGRGWVYDAELSLLGFGGIGDYSGMDLRPIAEWASLFAGWGGQYRLIMVERVDSSKRSVTELGNEYLGDDAHSGEFAVMFFDTFVTDFIFDGGGTLGGEVLGYDAIPMHTGGNWGMICTDGNTVIPFIFEHILRIDENTAFAKYNGKYGILDVRFALASR